MSVSDIEHFYKISSRKDNDRVNRIRENCILVLNNKEHPYFADSLYGEKWMSLRKGFEKFLKNQLEIKEKKNDIIIGYNLKKFAHLGNHFDFIVNVDLHGEKYSFIFEFKFKSMPQFVNIFEKDRYIPLTLAEFWYDEKILDKIISLYPLLKKEKPNRDSYLKDVNQMLTKKSKDSFYKEFYEFEHDGGYGKGSEIYKKKEEIIHENIMRYLNNHGIKFDIEKFKNKLLKDQPQKIYGIWMPDEKEFKRIEYTKEMLTPIKILETDSKMYLMIETEDPTRIIKCLLRWKNTNGICNPAWQISMETI